MRVIAADQRSAAELEASEGKPLDQIKVSLGVERYTDDVDAVFRDSDVVAIHVSASEATRNMIDARRLGLMKPSAVLINTSRGSVVDEAALYEALRARRIAGAALDVFQAEPYEPSAAGCDLRSLDNLVLSPHTASNTREANRRMAEACVANVAHFLAGRIDQLPRVD
jgi:phosphoglycerate dehydrogenase-like enzyme